MIWVAEARGFEEARYPVMRQVAVLCGIMLCAPVGLYV